MLECSVQSTKPMKKWTIDPKAIKKLYPLLYRDIEIGGKFTFPLSNKKGIVHRISSPTEIHTMDGASDSVQAPEGIANFHTHPISCYLGESTVWGWPSGEDIRETLLFGMKGSVVHLVLAIEGVYSMQVNPCILSSFMHIESETEKVLDKMSKSKTGRKLIKDSIKLLLRTHSRNSETNTFIKSKQIKSLSKYLKDVQIDLKNWLKTGDSGDYLVDAVSDIIRGIITLYIETYYRSSHRFRSHDLNSDKRNKLYPSDFIKFVNSFKISNIFNTGKKIKGCGNLSCGGVPVYEKNKRRVSKFSTYISNYEKDTRFYMVSSRGETLSLDTTLENMSGFSKYIKNVVIGNDCVNKNLGSWKKKWFKLTLSPNNVIIPGRRKAIPYISKRLSADDRINFLKYYNNNTPTDKVIALGSKAPTFYFYDIVGQNCNNNTVTKHLLSHVPRKSVRRSRRSKKRSNKNKVIICCKIIYDFSYH